MTAESHPAEGLGLRSSALGPRDVVTEEKILEQGSKGAVRWEGKGKAVMGRGTGGCKGTGVRYAWPTAWWLSHVHGQGEGDDAETVGWPPGSQPASRAKLRKDDTDPQPWSGDGSPSEWLSTLRVCLNHRV